MNSKRFFLEIFLVFILMLTTSAGLAAEKRATGGWEKGSAYNRLYNAAEMDNFKAVVVRVKKVVPMPGMSPGVALEIKEGKKGQGEKILVHLCPAWFADPGEIGIKKGDRIKLKGAWAEIGGKDVFMASKVKKGEYFEFKVRLTKDGTPFWTMDPKQLERERLASQAGLKKK
jgi:hypothetical protein